MSEMSRSSLVVLACAGGAVAGVVSWVLAAVLQAMFGEAGPGLLSLLLAVPRGALFGALLAWVIHAWCVRRMGKSDA
jgi:hypothetical protein